MKKIVTILFMFIFMIALHSAYAINIGASPSNVYLRNVLKAGYAERIISITTSSTDEVLGHFYAVGEIQDWLRFEPDDSNFSMSADKPFRLKIIVEPPEDAKNGSYSAKLFFNTDKLGSVSGAHGAGVKASVTLNIHVDITGKEIVGCSIGAVNVKNTEIGHPIEFSVSMHNKGNVRLKPEVEIDIWDQKQENLLISKTFSIKETLPTTTSTTIITIPSRDLAIGQYWADVTVKECGSATLLTFDILEKGAISDKGDLLRIRNIPWLYAGETTYITAFFKNTGERMVSAKFSGHIMLNDKIVELIESPELDVFSGETVELTTYYSPPKPGHYIISGRVMYNKKLTFEKASVINVMPKPLISIQGFIKTAPLIAYLIVIITIVFIVRKIILEKKNKKHK